MSVRTVRAVLSVAIVAAVGLVAPVALQQPVVAAPAGWAEFRHPTFGFSLKYPRSWDVLSGQGRAAFVAVGPQVAGAPGVRLGVVVVTMTLPPGSTLDAAAEELEQKLASEAATTRLLRQDRFDLHGTPALLVYVVRKNAQGVALYQMVMMLAHRNRGYAVAGTTAAESPRYTDDTALLQRIMLTFRPR
jgi:hypothetical protein